MSLSEQDLVRLQAPTGHPPHEWTKEEQDKLTKALKHIAIKENRIGDAFSTIANAHEFSHLPPPTKEDEIHLNKTLDKIFNQENKEMSTNDEMVIKSAEAAEQLLEQDGWSIVKELNRAVVDSLNQTGLVVLPIMSKLDEYKTKLSDPEGFVTKFETLNKDILVLLEELRGLSALSEGKSGKPSPDEMETIQILTIGYTRIQGAIERSVHPLILNLVDELEAIGVTELSV